MDSAELQKREKKRLYGIEYRLRNSQKLKDLHKWRLENDLDYAKRYQLKQDKRKHKYQESHKEAVEFRRQRSLKLAMEREARERERHKLVKRKFREENREKYNATMREYNRKNRDKINAKRRELWNNDLKYRSNNFYQRIKSNYGLSREQYLDLYLLSNGKCAICNISEGALNERGLVIDHCHHQGNVRGLLCGSCNTAIGLLNDDVTRLQNAIKYLNQFKE